MYRPPIEGPVNFHTALERAKTYYRSSRHWKMLEGTPWENDAVVFAADLMMDVQALWLQEPARPAIWRPMEYAPRDGTWILLRGRNSAGAKMVPIVARWGLSPIQIGKGPSWFGAESGKDLLNLIVDVPPGHAADWAHLPDWKADV